MRNSHVSTSPIEWLNTPPNEFFRVTGGWQPMNSPMSDGYGRHGREHWHARRKFLTSYHFEEKKDLTSKLNKDLKDKIKLSVRAINRTAMGFVSGVRHEISRRRVGVRVYRFTVAWPSLFVVRCFMPWLSKDQKYLNQ